MEATDLLPMDGDVAKITRRAEEFRDLPEAVQRNLQVFLTLTMDALASAHQKVKASMIPESTRQLVSSVCFMYANVTEPGACRLWGRFARNHDQL